MNHLASTRTPDLAAIARPSGSFAMVAMDQRESLRMMFLEAGVAAPTDDALIGFKLEVAAALAPHASGFLIDRHYGLDRLRRNRPLPASCGLVLAADDLTQQPGHPVEDTELDDAVLAPDFSLDGVDALKLLLIWRRDEHRERRVELARRFVAAARERGLLSVLEPVVRPAPGEEAAGRWDADVAIHEAAAELSPLGADLYKVQVPRAGRGSDDELLGACRALAEQITGPWVVLSQGVGREDFLRAVTMACRSGASGFLAGRALWSDLVGSTDLAPDLRRRAVPRLQRLCEVVDEHARPWNAA